MLDRAAAALIARQDEDGGWRDFWLPGGCSDEWVTAYVAAALANLSQPEAVASAQRAWSFLAGRAKLKGGWGYSAATPVDCDSTAWGLVLAERLRKAHEPAAVSARKMLAAAASRFGVATYKTDGEIRRYTAISNATAFSGWTHPHWCVSGAVALTSASPELLCTAIEGAQRSNGRWPSYWWRDDAYATATCATALKRWDRAPESRRRAAHWASRQSRDDAFATALILLALAAEDDGRTSDFAFRLRALQRADGSWRGGAWLRVPAPDIVNPRNAHYARWLGRAPKGRTVAMCNFESLDQRSIFTTATALWALTAAEGTT